MNVKKEGAIMKRVVTAILTLVVAVITADAAGAQRPGTHNNIADLVHALR